MNVADLISIIGNPSGHRELIKDFHNTGDIINSVIDQHNLNRIKGKLLARCFDGNSEYDISRKLWEFGYYKLNYKAEGNTQTVKSLSKILVDASNNKGNDCKHLSGFIAVILEALNIPFFYRFVCFDNSKVPTHVYCVSKSGHDEIIIDAVLPSFDSEKRFISKVDIQPQKKKLCHYIDYQV